MPAQLDSIDLFSPASQREPLAALLDRLGSRLGLQAIEKIGCRDEHLPELALHISNDSAGEAHGTEPDCAQRPFWLMPQPQLLRQQRQQLYWKRALKLLYGPERIEDNWWQEAVSRDYYIATDDLGPALLDISRPTGAAVVYPRSVCLNLRIMGTPSKGRG